MNTEDHRQPASPKAESGSYSDPEVQKLHAQVLREKEEPHEGFLPIPIFILFVFAIVIFYGGVYMGKNSAGFRWDVYDPNFDPASVAAASVAPAFDPIARGRRVYAQQCASCHQPDGSGVPGVYPPMFNSIWVTDSKIKPTAILLNGLIGEIEVAGNIYNGNMPAFGGILSDRDIAAVLTFIRQEWGNQAPPISEEQVAEARAAIGGRTTQFTAPELLALPELASAGQAAIAVEEEQQQEEQQEETAVETDEDTTVTDSTPDGEAAAEAASDTTQD